MESGVLMWLWSSQLFCFSIIIFNVTPGPPISALPLYCTAYLEIKKRGNASFGFIILRDHQIETFHSNLGWKVLETNQIICSFFLPCLFALSWGHPHPKFGIPPVQMLGYWSCWPPLPFLSSDKTGVQNVWQYPYLPSRTAAVYPQETQDKTNTILRLSASKPLVLQGFVEATWGALPLIPPGGLIGIIVTLRVFLRRLEMFSFRSKHSLSQEDMHCIRQGFQSFREFMVYMEFWSSFLNEDTVALSSVNFHVYPVNINWVSIVCSELCAVFFREDTKHMVLELKKETVWWR